MLGVPAPTPLVVAVDPPRVVHAFRPDRAFGMALDGHERGDTRRIYTRANIRAMASAGLRSASYRLRTELGVEAWHWNSAGHWSDARHHRGYWTSSWRTRRPIRVSYGYRLPRRGDTVDQAEDDGYSRLDDGRARTFWKSDPYLDPHFAHVARPQWVLVDLRRPRRVDAVRVRWGTPYATRFQVERFDGPSAIALAGHPPGRWRWFARARFTSRGGVQTLRVADRPQPVRFVRVLLTRSSHTAPRGSRDVRDRLGYAIRELGVGTLRGGRFHDLVRHAPSGARQTVTLASSTDPWHTARDRDPDYDQPGFSTVLASGLARGRGMLAPVSVLYGTPANAVAELRWLRAHRVALRGIELGEEPDGQLASPEDYGTLYAEFARALARADPRVALGGPSLQTAIPDWVAWPDAHGERSWTRRFVGELRRRGALRRLNFFSFEWYPFDDGCAAVGPQLARAPAMLAATLRRQRAEGVPARVPFEITELGYSAFAARAEVDLPGAVLDADAVGTLLAHGGDAAYVYGPEPDALIRELPHCDTWGNLTLWLSRSDRRIKHPTAALWAARLLSRTWTQPGDALHRLLAASVSPRAAVSAYAVRRPDRRLAVLLINRDPRHAYAAAVRVGGAAAGPLETATLSRADYAWHPGGPGGYPRPDAPPVRAAVAGGTPVALPPLSVVVAVKRR